MAPTTPPCPTLPVELVRAIAQRVATARVLVTMMRICNDWKAAANDESIWEVLVLRRFPRMRALLQMLPSNALCYRDIYRNQLENEPPPSSSMPECVLANFT